MTTIAVTRKEIAADSRCVWDGVGTDAYSSIKIYRGHANLYAITGEECNGSLQALDWITTYYDRRKQPGTPTAPEPTAEAKWQIVELSVSGISVYNRLCEREETLEPVLALGSGRKVALYCMKYMNMTPAEAVAEACKVDDYSDHPIYVAHLADLAIRKWNP